MAYLMCRCVSKRAVYKEGEGKNGMDDRVDEVINHYPINVRVKKRVRGALLLETDEGRFVAKMYSAGRQRLEFEESVKKLLTAHGYSNVDEVVENKEGDIVTDDGIGNKWIVKRWYAGRECDIKNMSEVCSAVSNMAHIHKMMVFGAEMKSGDMSRSARNDIRRIFEKHNREMKHVHRYIRDKRQKNEMEICLLNSFKEFYRQGKLAQDLLEESGYDVLYGESVNRGCVMHGSYNYHNILFDRDTIITTNFEKADIGLQITDLYDFLRKIMEKSGWNITLGIRMLECYKKVREPGESEKKVLYAMLVYPEKYWKLINFYYNGKKTWMSAKNFDKLQRICGQENDRDKFLKEAKKLLIS